MKPIHLLVCAALLAAAACTKDSGEKSASAATPPTGEAGVIAAWQKAGLTVSAFDDADGAKYGGGACRGGQINGVDAVLCTYDSDELATAAEASGRQAIGLATGSALTQGSLMLVMADRRKADPEGRTINQATKLFRGR